MAEAYGCLISAFYTIAHIKDIADNIFIMNCEITKNLFKNIVNDHSDVTFRACFAYTIKRLLAITAS
ncbi:hypothetical protein [Candidatus Nitrosotenuis uzonensis]|uniref:Uncharacterized protein n=1 Tax=Candidatus Nitrosotenuis uzonensis TaxID=1407055 RepID=A0A812F2X3_9ARCH|nr:hypothetical protein [Candidatus Nitrosotenuis uzonensis]CAE6493004.1 conserved hypothetical protein [Candidatus Nitrosotenuis uzonensis]